MRYITLLADLATRVVEPEVPVHRDLVARRVAEAFGKAGTGNRIREASDRALGRVMLTGGVLADGEFLMTPTQKEDPRPGPVRRGSPDERGPPPARRDPGRGGQRHR